VLQDSQGFFYWCCLLVFYPGVGTASKCCCRASRPMQLVEIKIVGLHALQTVVQSLRQVLSVQECLAITNVPWTLCIALRAGCLAGQDDLVATSGFRQP